MTREEIHSPLAVLGEEEAKNDIGGGGENDY